MKSREMLLALQDELEGAARVLMTRDDAGSGEMETAASRNMLVPPMIAALESSAAMTESRITEDVRMARDAIEKILQERKGGQQGIAADEPSTAAAFSDPLLMQDVSRLLRRFSSWPFCAEGEVGSGGVEDELPLTGQLLDCMIADQLISDGMPREIALKICPRLHSLNPQKDWAQADDELALCLKEVHNQLMLAAECQKGTQKDLFVASGDGIGESTLFPKFTAALAKRLHPTMLSIEQQVALIALEDAALVTYVARIWQLLLIGRDGQSDTSAAAPRTDGSSTTSTAWFLLGREISCCSSSVLATEAGRLRDRVAKLKHAEYPSQPEGLSWRALLVAVGLAQQVAQARGADSHTGREERSRQSLLAAAEWSPILLACPTVSEFGSQCNSCGAPNTGKCSELNPFTNGHVWLRDLAAFMRNVAVCALKAPPSFPASRRLLLEEMVYRVSEPVLSRLDLLCRSQMLSEHLARWSQGGDEEGEGDGLVPVDLGELPSLTAACGVKHFASFLYCPVAKSRTVDPSVIPDPSHALYNPPRLLACGHCISHKAARMICSTSRRGRSGQVPQSVTAASLVRCPYCSAETPFGETLVLRLAG